MLRLGLSYQHRAMPYGLLLTEDWPEFTQDADRRALEPQGGRRAEPPPTAPAPGRARGAPGRRPTSAASTPPSSPPPGDSD